MTSETTPRRRTSAEEDHETNPWRESALNKPKYRGVLHTWAFFVSIPVLILVTATAPTFRSGFAAAHYGFGVTIMLGISALFHRQDYTNEGWFSFRRLDHVGIYLCIAGGFTPIGMLALDGWQRPTVLIVGWTGAALGITLRFLPFKPPYGMMTGLFIALSWSIVIVLPTLWGSMSRWSFICLGLGGMFFTLGAFVVGARRPDPWPQTFGYHEIWHTCVVAAVCLHYPIIAFEFVR